MSAKAEERELYNIREKTNRYWPLVNAHVLKTAKATQGWSFPRHLHIEANMYNDSHLILYFKGETMYLSEGLIQLTVGRPNNNTTRTRTMSKEVSLYFLIYSTFYT